MQASYLPRAKSHVQFPFLKSFQRISPIPTLYETFSNSGNRYGVELLATGRPSKLEDTPYRLSGTAYSLYYHLPSVSVDHLLHRKLRIGHTVMTRKHSVQLMIHYNYHDCFYHRPVFLVSLTVLLKKFTPQPKLTSTINALSSLSIIDLVLILILLVWTLSDIVSY